MGTLCKWAAVSSIAGLILLSPVVAFLIIIATEMLIDGLMEAGVTAVCAVTVGVLGWVLFRSVSLHPATAAQPRGGFERASAEEEPAIIGAAPTITRRRRQASLRKNASAR